MKPCRWALTSDLPAEAAFPPIDRSHIVTVSIIDPAWSCTECLCMCSSEIWGFLALPPEGSITQRGTGVTKPGTQLWCGCASCSCVHRQLKTAAAALCCRAVWASPWGFVSASWSVSLQLCVNSHPSTRLWLCDGSNLTFLSQSLSCPWLIKSISYSLFAAALTVWCRSLQSSHTHWLYTHTNYHHSLQHLAHFSSYYNLQRMLHTFVSPSARIHHQIIHHDI